MLQDQISKQQINKINNDIFDEKRLASIFWCMQNLNDLKQIIAKVEIKHTNQTVQNNMYRLKNELLNKDQIIIRYLTSSTENTKELVKLDNAFKSLDENFELQAEKFNNELLPGNSELIKVKINPIMQLIDDEIKRLEKPNYFLNSSKNKIGALEILKYKIKEHIDSKTLQEIITDWKNDNTKFKKLNTKDNKVAIGLIIKENRNAFFSQWRKNITGTEKFIDNLQIDFGSFTAGEKNEARIDSKSPPLR